MKDRVWLAAALGVAMLTGVLDAVAATDAPPVALRSLAGALVGLVTGADRLPLAGATVTAMKSDGSAIRATISGSNGVYSFDDLIPGEWALTVQVEGLPEIVLKPVPVAAGKAARRDLVLNGAAASTALAVATLPPTAPMAQKPASSFAQIVSLGLQAPDPVEGVDEQTPFAFGDFTWLNGSPRNKTPAFDTKFFTPDIRMDVHYMQDFNGPKDHTIVGSTESFRSGEFQLEQISFGGDFHWDNVRARFLSMYGLFSETTPRNDASTAVGQWDLGDAYRYLSEANIG